MRGRVRSDPDAQADAAWAGAVLADELEEVEDESLDEDDFSAVVVDDDSAFTLALLPARLSVR